MKMQVSNGLFPTTIRKLFIFLKHEATLSVARIFWLTSYNQAIIYILLLMNCQGRL